MSEFPGLFDISTDRSDKPLQLYWPGATSPVECRTFSDFSEWRDFIEGLSLKRPVPQTLARKFARAQRLYILAWVDGHDIIKAGELAALVALELALRDVYPTVYQKRDKNGNFIRAYLEHGLKHMVEHDGLTDGAMPIYQKYHWPVVANLYKRKKEEPTMTLVDIRNSLAHGDPFDAMPWSGLLEVVRDLIDYMYRTWPATVGRS
jgi:hypothetical protein